MKAAGLFKYVWPFCYHQAFKGWPFKRQPKRMFKHTQRKCVGCCWQFVWVCWPFCGVNAEQVKKKTAVHQFLTNESFWKCKLHCEIVLKKCYHGLISENEPQFESYDVDLLTKQTTTQENVQTHSKRMRRLLLAICLSMLTILWG